MNVNFYYHPELCSLLDVLFISDCSGTRTHNHLVLKRVLNQATKECGFTLKRVHDMIRTYSRAYTAYLEKLFQSENKILKNDCDLVDFCTVTLHKKMKFSINHLFSKCDDLVTFTEEIFNGRLQFLCSVRACMGCWILYIHLKTAFSFLRKAKYEQQRHWSHGETTTNLTTRALDVILVSL